MSSNSKKKPCGFYTCDLDESVIKTLLKRPGKKLRPGVAKTKRVFEKIKVKNFYKGVLAGTTNVADLMKEDE